MMLLLLHYWILSPTYTLRGGKGMAQFTDKKKQHAHNNYYLIVEALKRGEPGKFLGHYKTWTVDYGLDCGLDSGLDFSR